MKKVATSLATLDSSEPWKRILDPNDSCDDLAAELIEHWGYDLHARSPRRAVLEDGILKPTDLDLACFLSTLVDRGAVIELPTYELRRPATQREGERVVSKDHRHGKVLGLESNKEVFSFSVKISDLNVVFNSTTCPRCRGQDFDPAIACVMCNGTKVVQSPNGEGESAGAPRNFMLVDLDGRWHDGWKSIVFTPKRKENEFIAAHGLLTGNSIVFENFIHPNRWVSFYGSWYLLTKLLVERFRSEASACGYEVKRILAAGQKFPDAGPGAEREWGESKTVGPAASVTVPAFEAEIDADVPRSFPAYPTTQAGLLAAKARMNHLRYGVTRALSFHVRATELAFCNKADSFAWLPEVEREHRAEPFPAWISGAAWEHDYKIKRTAWNRLVLGRHAPFVAGMALRYRVFNKKERVAG
jgi:hypothetical protein